MTKNVSTHYILCSLLSPLVNAISVFIKSKIAKYLQNDTFY